MIAVMAVAFSVNAKSAAAAVVDFSGSVVEMTPEPLDIGQTGTIDHRRWRWRQFRSEHHQRHIASQQHGFI